MVFKYDDYFRTCFFVPTVAFLFLTFVVVSIIVSSVRSSNGRKDKLGKMGIIVALMCFWLIYPLQHLGILISGGFHLFYEDEASAVEMYGTIEDINNLDQRHFPQTDLYGASVSNGVQFIIDGVPYSSFSKGDFSIGEQVYVSVLPKSGYILSITKVP